MALYPDQSPPIKQEVAEKPKDTVATGLVGQPHSSKAEKDLPSRNPDIVQFGDDAGFIYVFPNNEHGIIVAGAALDGVSEGGKGHLNAVRSAEEIKRALEAQFVKRRRSGSHSRYTRQEIGATVACAILGDINKDRVAEKEKMWQGSELSVKTFMSGLSMFLIQEGFDNQTGERFPYLHAFFTADCELEVYLTYEDDTQDLIPLGLPHNVAGKWVRAGIQTQTEKHNEVQVESPVHSLTIAQIAEIYKDQQEKVEKKYPDLASGVTAGLGDQRTLQLYYFLLRLPQKGEIYRGKKLTGVQISALTDGVKGFTSERQRINTIKYGSGPQDSAQKMINLARKTMVPGVAEDDALAIVAQINLAS